MKKQRNNWEELGLVRGEPIDNLIGDRIQVIADLVFVWDQKGNCKVFDKKSILQKTPQIYRPNGQDIVNVYLPENHEILILKTEKEIFVHDYNNQPIEDAKNWTDFYVEPNSGRLYRKDSHQYWYDIEGHRLGAVIFLQNDILISLIGKTSLQSLSFRDQEIVISPNAHLIQIGKLVFDNQLKRIRYYGEKITGLGTKNIKFSNDESVQEIWLGLNQTALVYESTNEPFLINEEPVVQHLQTVQKRGRRFEVFATATQNYVIHAQDKRLVTCDTFPVNIDFQNYYNIDDQELGLCEHRDGKYYMDTHAATAFRIPEICSEPINFIAPEVVQVNGHRLRNMRTEKRTFVYSETMKSIYTLNEGTLIPESIVDPEKCAQHYGIVYLENRSKLFYKKRETIIQLSKDKIEIQSIIGDVNQKLLNAETIDGEKIVLDARNSFDQLTQAFSNEQAIVEVFGAPINIGTFVLQNVALKTLGGTQKRVIDLNDPQLAVFTLPTDLSAYPEDERPSIYQGNPIRVLDFETPIEIEGTFFVSGEFIPFHDRPVPILIQQKNGLPLHLEGGGHRNELLISFVPETLEKPFLLGVHRMIGAQTLTEDNKENEILFSLQTQKSWLPFNEQFLPIFKRVIELKEANEEQLLLYEVRDTIGKSEYLVVENKPPYGIWVNKNAGKEVPKIVKRIDRTISLVEEPSLLKKLFGTKAGYFKEMV